MICTYVFILMSTLKKGRIAIFKITLNGNAIVPGMRSITLKLVTLAFVLYRTSLTSNRMRETTTFSVMSNRFQNDGKIGYEYLHHIIKINN